MPARRKFLKKDSTEAMNVTALVEKVALSKPEISIQLLIDGEERFKTPGDGSLLNAIYAVYGKEFSSQEIKSILMVARNLNIPAISMKEEETIEYRRPQKNVDHLLRPMVRYLARQANVDSCYVVDMIRGCERPQTLFVFDMLGNTRKLFFPLSKYMQTYTKSGDSLVFLSLEEDAAKKAIDGIEPFYIRKKRYFER